MNTKKTNAKYHLLVLTDLSKSSENALKSAVQLAKTIKGSVEVLHVRPPADVINYENQFSAMRAIQEDSRSAQSKLRQTINTISKKEGIPITFRIAYGNVKSKIKEHIDKVDPQIVLLGKRRSKLIKFLGDSVTEFVLKNCTSNILIGGDDHTFHSFKDISMGVYGEALAQEGFEIINDLNPKGKNSIRFFKVKSQKSSKKRDVAEHNAKSVSYVFSEGANAWDGLAEYVSRTNMQLFCIPREESESKSSFFSLKGIEIPIRQIVHRLNIPVLIMR